MNKTVEEYMKYPYTIELTPGDDGYFVKVKELPGCMSVGDTRAEALEMIEDAMRGWLEVALEDGVAIPLPQAMQKGKFSGRFALRLPKGLHAALAEAAECEGVSLNQYMVTLLAEKNSYHEVKRLLGRKIPGESGNPEMISGITTGRPHPC